MASLCLGEGWSRNQREASQTFAYNAVFMHNIISMTNICGANENEKALNLSASAVLLRPKVRTTGVLSTTHSSIRLLFAVLLTCLFGSYPCLSQELLPQDLPNSPSYSLQTQTSIRHEIGRSYLHEMFGWDAAYGIGFTSAFGQIDNKPTEWGNGAPGFGRRLGSASGEYALSQSIRYGLGYLSNRNPGYRRLGVGSIPRRALHAVLGPVTAERRDGSEVFDLSTVIGSCAGGVIAVKAWYPDRIGARDGLRIGAQQVLWIPVGNLFNEFLPRK